jgi:hypothetical protein
MNPKNTDKVIGFDSFVLEQALIEASKVLSCSISQK